MSGATGATATAVFTPNVTPNDGLDDYAGIQSSIDQANAAGGGIVPLPAGELDLTGHIWLKSGVKLVGQGDAFSATPTTIKAISGFLNSPGPAGGGYNVVSTYQQSNVTLADVVLDQNGGALVEPSPQRGYSFLLDIRNSSNALIDSVSTRNPATYSIAFVSADHSCVRGSDTQVDTSGVYGDPTCCSGQLDGLHVLDSSFIDLDNNVADQRFNGNTDGDDALAIHTVNGTTHDISAIGNKLHGGYGGDGIQIAIGNFNVYNITLQTNEVYDSPEGIRTGYYDQKTGGLDHLLIGGPESTLGNNIHDINGSPIAFPSNSGNAVDIGLDAPGSSPITNVVVTWNRDCNFNQILVRSDPTNVVANNTGC